MSSLGSCPVLAKASQFLPFSGPRTLRLISTEKYEGKVANTAEAAQ